MPLDLAGLGAALAGVAGGLAWFTRLERRIGRKVERKEYAEDRRTDAAEVASRYGELKQLLAGQGQQAERHRERLFEELTELGKDVVAVQTKLGMQRRRRRENPHPRSGD